MSCHTGLSSHELPLMGVSCEALNGMMASRKDTYHQEVVDCGVHCVSDPGSGRWNCNSSTEMAPFNREQRLDTLFMSYLVLTGWGCQQCQAPQAA